MSGMKHDLKVRLEKQMHDCIKAAAKENGRSVNAEIIERLRAAEFSIALRSVDARLKKLEAATPDEVAEMTLVQRQRFGYDLCGVTSLT